MDDESRADERSPYQPPEAPLIVESPAENYQNFSSAVVFFFFFHVTMMAVSPFSGANLGTVIGSVLLMHVIGGGVAIIIARRGFDGSLLELLQIKRPHQGFLSWGIKTTILLLVAMWISFYVSYIVMQLLQLPVFGHPVSEIAEKMDSVWQWLVLWAMTSLVAPFFEEVIFRRFLFQSLALKVGAKKANFISCALFSLIHFVPVAYVGYYLIARILQRSMEREKNIIYPYFAHMLYNSTLTLLMFLAQRIISHA